MSGVNSGYTVGRPLQDVRLRNWPAGKVAQLKRAVSLLEDQLNTTMAAQVDQGTAAKVSARVPKVTGLAIHAGFKNFQVTFNDAKGIDDLLFYEVQQDTTSNFPNPTIFRIPQTTLTMPTTQEHQSIFIRVRAQNSKFEVGPWSTTVHATGSSNFRITVNRQDRTTKTIALANLDVWTDIIGVTYTPTAAAMCINIHAGVFTTNSDNRLNLPGSGTYSSEVANAVTFRLLRNGVELTNCGTMDINGDSTYLLEPASADVNWFLMRREMTEVGTLITPLETFTGNEAAVTFILQARLNTSANTFRTSTSGSNVANEGLTIIVDAFDVMEIVQSL
jgi:hypothetical protein